MAHPAPIGYTVDDLDWLRDEIGVAHLELDPWGTLIVSPASHEHDVAQGRLLRQTGRQLDDSMAVLASFAWSPPGGSPYVCVPDLTVLAPQYRHVGDLHIDPPPLLVVEIASPSTRRTDRTRKLADYRAGGAGAYLLVDLPATFELHDFAAGTMVVSTGAIELVVGGHPVRLELP